MKTTARHHHIRNSLFAACFALIFGSTALAAEAPPAEDLTVDKKPVVIKKKEDIFDYQIEGRSDPFLPFISERTTSPEDPNEILDPNLQLSGMQLFEPGQLTLVALMSSGENQYAMVQDFTGKGYVIVKGTKIGRRGVVSNIVDNKVIIEETAHTRGGKILKNQIAMVLKKEEGEE